MRHQVFVITVTGELDDVLRGQLDDVEVIAGHGVSQIRADCPDRSMLYGLLHRLEVLRLEVLDVRPIEEMPAS